MDPNMLKHTIKPPIIASEVLEELYEMDEPNQFANSMYTMWKRWIESQHIADPGLLEIRYFEKFKHLTVELSGSLNENVDIPERYFVPDDTENQISLSAGEEIDCTVTLDYTTASDRNADHIVMEYITWKPGFVYLKIEDADQMQAWLPLSTIICDEFGMKKEVYISPIAFTDEWYLLLLCKNSLFTCFNICMEERSKESKIYVVTTQEGPAIKSTIFESHDRFQIDTAIAIKCLEWPSAADEWFDRKRISKWPSASLINECKKLGACLVPKYPYYSLTMLEWRISFVNVEGALMRSLTKMQRVCYRIFKGIWRIGFRAPATRYVQSYHIKTIFLWFSEKMRPSDFNLESIVTRVFDLLHSLRTCLMQKCCPHYFIPENNLFSDLSEIVISKTLQHVNISITKADEIWIYNRGLFLLPCPTLTRVSLSVEMTLYYIECLKKFASLFDLVVMKKKVNIGKEPEGKDYLLETNLKKEGFGYNSSIEESVNDSDGDEGHDKNNGDDDDSDDGDNDESNEDDDGCFISESTKIFWRQTVNTLVEAFCNTINEKDDLKTALAIITEVAMKNDALHDDVYRYLCTRTSPKHLLRFEKDEWKGLINGVAELISFLGSYGNLLYCLMNNRKIVYDS